MAVFAPALEGWYTLDRERPHLIGSRCASCGTCYFPRVTNFCRNPACGSAQLEEALLSRTGRIWSYTDASYQPPEPYVSPQPFAPFAIAAVELEAERMIILGQVAQGYGVGDLQIGMAVELVLETLLGVDGTEKLIWKWKPLREAR